MHAISDWLPPLIIENRDEFRRNGYLLVRGYLDAGRARRLADAVRRYCTEHTVIDVQKPASKFSTFNGSEVDTELSELARLYDREVLQAVNSVSRWPVEALTDRRVGLSVNVTPKGGRFTAHFDRHRMTAVLYLNEGYTGGSMILYPRVRHVLPGRYLPVLRQVQALLDRFTKSPRHLGRSKRRIVIQPHAGDLLIFEAVSSLHRVETVHDGGPRLSVQFGYDLPGTRFDTRDYYGQ